MKCPQCGQDSFQSVLACGECGREIDLGASLQVDTRVQRNLGTVIGAQIGQLNAPVIRDSDFNTQVYVWHGDWSEKVWEGMLKETARPYKYLLPYMASERALFAGREGEADTLVARIVDQRLVLLHGQQGVGKTSLMNAGVIPVLLKMRMVVLSTDNYLQPVESLRRDLAAQREHLELDPGDVETISDLLVKISEQIRGAITLVLDQFERLFANEIDRNTRESFLEELRSALEQIEPGYLRVVFVADRSIFEHISDLEAHLPGLSHDHFELGPLPLDRARQAILHPFLQKPERATYQIVRYSDALLKVLVDDLDILTDKLDWREKIHPQHLGIVCNHLYEKAIAARVIEVGEGFYDDLGGAQGILQTHFRDRLTQDLGGAYARAKRLLLRMIVPEAPTWMNIAQISRNGREDDAEVLRRLVNAGYLTSRSSNSHEEYAFLSDSYAIAVETLDEALMASRRRAREVLELAWNLWVERDEAATRGQLRYLADFGEHLEPRLDRALFLLYSALAKGEPTAGALAWLEKAPHSRELIEYFEEPGRASAPDRVSHSIEREARKLLGLQGLEAPDWSADPKISSGPLAWAAAQAADEYSANTATLALVHGYGYGAWNRVDWAIGKLEDSREAARLRADRRGLLMDELSGYREYVQSENLSGGELRRIWWWRARRRMSRSARDLGWMAAGAALGGGLLTGLMRLLIAIPAVSDIAGISFAIQGYWNAILAGGAALGALVASPLLLDGEASAGELPAALKPFARAETGEARLSVLLGTLGFTLFFLLAAVFNGVSFAARPLLLLTAPLAGLGVALGLAGQPGAGRPKSAGAWARRLIPGGLGFVLAQAAAQIAGLSGAGTITNKAPKYYIDEFSYIPPIQRLFESSEWAPVVLSLLDAAAIGALLTAGMILGIHAARDWRARWDAFVRHTEV